MLGLKMGDGRSLDCVYYHLSEVHATNILQNVNEVERFINTVNPRTKYQEYLLPLTDDLPKIKLLNFGSTV